MKTCNNCEKPTEDMTYVTVKMSSADWERQADREEREKKRKDITIIILIILFILSNALWIWRESQFEDVETYEEVIVDADDGGNANYIGNDGDINNGKNND